MPLCQFKEDCQDAVARSTVLRRAHKERWRSFRRHGLQPSQVSRCRRKRDRHVEINAQHRLPIAPLDDVQLQTLSSQSSGNAAHSYKACAQGRPR